MISIVLGILISQGLIKLYQSPGVLFFKKNVLSLFDNYKLSLIFQLGFLIFDRLFDL